ncbi:MAG TPA: hypothetical protein VGE14_16195 [Marmoricola sp.]
MTVIPFPAQQQAPVAPPPPRPGPVPDRAALHLVPAHDHTWRLQGVEFDGGLEIRCFECADCGDVRFS